MQAILKEIEEPPSAAQSVEGNDMSDDEDLLLAKRYVEEVVFNPSQRRMVRTIERSPTFRQRAVQLSEIPREKRRVHHLYCDLHTTQERLAMKTFLSFMDLTMTRVELLKGEHGESLRLEWQSALGQGEGM